MGWSEEPSVMLGGSVSPLPSSTVHFLPIPLFVAAALVACSPSSAPKEDPKPRVWATPAYDGTRAFADLTTLVNFGPRPSGSEANAKMAQFLADELTKAGLQPVFERFESDVPVTEFTPEGHLAFANLYADLPGEDPNGPMVILGSHMDTKFMDDFVGANDGGSSTAVLLELARGFAKAAPRPVSYRFVFFDGEEAVRPHWEDPDNTYGSKHHVYELSKKREFARVKAFVLLDMVGDKNLKLTREEFSTRWLAELFEQAGTEGGYGKYFGGTSQPLKDDHIPFLAKGIPSIDLIDFEYPYWHKPTDTLDKCSVESLEAIGQITRLGLLKLEAKLTAK